MSFSTCYGLDKTTEYKNLLNLFVVVRRLWATINDAIILDGRLRQIRLKITYTITAKKRLVVNQIYPWPVDFTLLCF